MSSSISHTKDHSWIVSGVAFQALLLSHADDSAGIFGMRRNELQGVRWMNHMQSVKLVFLSCSSIVVS